MSVPKNFKPEWNAGQDALWAGKEIWHGLAKALEYLGLPVDASKMSDEAFDYFIYQAQAAKPIPWTTLRNVKDTSWGSGPADYKNDPMYSVGHNQGPTVAERMLAPVKPRHELMSSEVPILPIKPAQALNPWSAYGSRLEFPADLPIEIVRQKNAIPGTEKTSSPAWTQIGFG